MTVYVYVYNETVSLFGNKCTYCIFIVLCLWHYRAVIKRSGNFVLLDLRYFFNLSLKICLVYIF